MKAKDDENCNPFLTIGLTIEDNQVVAYCKETGTGTFGDSLEEACKNIGEALQLDIEANDEIGNNISGKEFIELSKRKDIQNYIKKLS